MYNKTERKLIQGGLYHLTYQCTLKGRFKAWQLPPSHLPREETLPRRLVGGGNTLKKLKLDFRRPNMMRLWI